MTSPGLLAIHMQIFHEYVSCVLIVRIEELLKCMSRAIYAGQTLMRNFCRKMARACKKIYSVIVIERFKVTFFVHSCVATSKSVVMYDMHCVVCEETRSAVTIYYT